MTNVAPLRTYQDFEIHIQRGPSAFDVTATGGDRTARSPLHYDWRTDPVTEKMLQGLRPTGLDPGLLKEFGHRLFDVLFQEEIRSLFYQLKDEALRAGQGLKLLLRVDDPGLAALPWEYLWDPRVEGFVAIDSETPLVRYVVPPEPLPPFPVAAPLRVLVVISNPGQHSRDLYISPLDVQAEQEKLQRALAELTGAGLVQLRFLHDEEQATPGAIRRLMRDLRPHVFHFIGHGGYEETEGDEARPFLILENEDQSPRRIYGEGFRAFFVGFNETKLVILNACDTTRLVPKLVNEGIAAVVAMQQPITDDVAASFSEEFYQALASNNPISAAVSETRRAIYQDFPSFPGTWGFPVVFLTDRQGVVFDLRAPARAVKQESVVSSAGALADIANAQAEKGDFLGALETAQQIEDRDLQGRVGAGIAAQLAQAGEINRALEVAEDLGPADADSGFAEDYRSQALAGIADAQVSGGDFPAALRTVQKIEHPDTRGRVTAHVAEQLAQAGEIQRALEVAEGLGPADPRGGFAKDYRSQALASIAEAQAGKGDFPSALDTAEKIEDDDVRSRIRTHIASELAQAGETGAALQVAEGIEDQESHAEPRPETTRVPAYEVIEEEKEDEENRATPSAPRVWFYMATGDDERQVNLLAQRDALSWGANPNTHAGDLVLMYRTAPYSDFAYLFRAQSDAREAQQTENWPWSHAVELGDKVPLERPVTLAQVRAHPRLADWNLAQIPRGAMRRAADVRAEGYWEPLRGLLVAWNPQLGGPLANWERLDPDDLLAEALAVAREIQDEAERAAALAILDAQPGRAPRRTPPPRPPTVVQLLTRAREQLSHKRYDEVIEALQGAADQWQQQGSQQERALAHTLLAQAYEGQNQPERALDHWRQATELAPASAEAFAGLARTIPEGEREQEKQRIQQLGQRAQDAAGPQVGLAEIERRQGNLAQAVERYDEALSRDQDNKQALLGKAQVLDVQGDSGTALDLYERLVELESHPAARALFQTQADRLRQSLAGAAPGELTVEDVTQVAGVAQVGSGNIAANELNVTLDSLQVDYGWSPQDIQRMLRNLSQQVAQLPTLSQAQKTSFQTRAAQAAQRAAQTGDVAQARAELNALRGLSFTDYLFVDQPPQRRALIRAARNYRERPQRRTVLYLRSVARQQIRERWLTGERVTQRQEYDALVEAVWREGTVTYREQPARTIAEIVAGVEANLTPQDWRRAGQEGTLEITGNLCFDAGPPADPPDLVWEQLYDLRYNQREEFESRDSWWRFEHTGLDPLRASSVLYVFDPETHLPYDEALVRQALRRLGLPDEKLQELTYRSFIRFARNLLLDEDLGLESLDDAGYFLHLVAAGEVALWVDEREDESAPIHSPLENDVALDPRRIDSVLRLRRGSFDQLASALSAGNHVILIGPPGTGKTTLAHDVCRYAHDRGYNRGFVSVTATADWTTFDTVGGYMPTASGELVFSEGVFLRAIREQKWLVIDEINRADIDKAFGELFTVLSGQGVTLPYRHGYDPISVLPPGAAGQTGNDYVIPPGWRIIGTMNVYDKASLFEMSYAFMRRFAFVDVGVPGPDTFTALIDHFVGQNGFANNDPIVTVLKDQLFSQDREAGVIMKCRQLGPAIAKDMISYLRQRRKVEAGRDLAHLGEAFLLYAIPQFDGLEEEKVVAIFDHLGEVFQDAAEVALAIRNRLRELFPQYAGAFKSEEEIAAQPGGGE
jgi:MoxR-like ATPase/tetratricopeptide (TPR) repeat protein